MVPAPTIENYFLIFLVTSTLVESAVGTLLGMKGRGSNIYIYISSHIQDLKLPLNGDYIFIPLKELASRVASYICLVNNYLKKTYWRGRNEWMKFLLENDGSLIVFTVSPPLPQ